jgi:hypothetical protein
MHRLLAALLALALWLHPAAARVAAAGALIGAPVHDLRGEAVGTVEDFIVDVSDGRRSLHDHRWQTGPAPAH